MTHVVVLTNDIGIGSQVTGGAKLAGHTAAMALNLDQMVSRAATAPSLVVIDLAFPLADPQAVAAKLAEMPEPRPKFVAFGPHVDTARLAAARAAGCAAVFTRGQFLLNMPAAIASVLEAGE